MGNNLEFLINEKTNNKFDFKIKSATLSKKTGKCLVELFYKDGVILSKGERVEVENLIVGFLPSGFAYDIKFIKNFVVNESVLDSVKEFMHCHFPSILFDIVKVNCENQDKKVVLSIEKSLIEYVKEKKLKEKLEKQLIDKFNQQINVEIEQNLNNRIETLEIPDDDIPEFDTVVERFIEVDQVEPFIGELQDNKAFYIKDKKEPGLEVVFCGRVSFFKEYSYNVKPRKKEEDDGDDSVITRYFYKFTLQGFTGKISCVFFANRMNITKIQELEDNQEIIVRGNLEEDKFNNGVSLRVKEISFCVLPEKFEEYIAYKSEPKEYRMVFPEPYVNYAQSDLFGSLTNYPSFIMDNTFVVFDFETTGLEVINGDKIVEIGAVKVKEGKIVEKFSCLVNPEMKIPQESIKVHGIHDADVADAPTIEKVMPDFYKFTRGAILSGYNVGFDFGFLEAFGKKCGYNFDNPLLDIYKIVIKNVKGLKKYKLKPVAEYLGVALDNAHRAVYDTIATAEVFLKVADHYEDGWLKK